MQICSYWPALDNFVSSRHDFTLKVTCSFDVETFGTRSRSSYHYQGINFPDVQVHFSATFAPIHPRTPAHAHTRARSILIGQQVPAWLAPRHRILKVSCLWGRRTRKRRFARVFSFTVRRRWRLARNMAAGYGSRTVLRMHVRDTWRSQRSATIKTLSTEAWPIAFKVHRRISNVTFFY